MEMYSSNCENYSSKQQRYREQVRQRFKEEERAREKWRESKRSIAQQDTVRMRNKAKMQNKQAKE